MIDLLNGIFEVPSNPFSKTVYDETVSQNEDLIGLEFKTCCA